MAVDVPSVIDFKGIVEKLSLSTSLLSKDDIPLVMDLPSPSMNDTTDISLVPALLLASYPSWHDEVLAMPKTEVAECWPTVSAAPLILPVEWVRL